MTADTTVYWTYQHDMERCLSRK